MIKLHVTGDTLHRQEVLPTPTLSPDMSKSNPEPKYYRRFFPIRSSVFHYERDNIQQYSLRNKYFSYLD